MAGGLDTAVDTNLIDRPVWGVLHLRAMSRHYFDRLPNALSLSIFHSFDFGLRFNTGHGWSDVFLVDSPDRLLASMVILTR